MTDLKREEIELLLPWLANGTLSEIEKSQIERGLERFPELRKQLTLIDEEAAVTFSSNEEISLPASLNATALLDKLGVAQPNAQDSSPWSRVREAISALWLGPARLATVAAALLLAVQFATIAGLLFERGKSGYVTASGHQGAPGSLVLVRFADGAAMADLTSKLAAANFTVVDGPKAGGLYSLRIGEASLSAVDKAQRVDQLKAMTGVISLVLPSQ